MATAFLALNTLDGVTPAARRWLNASPSLANSGVTFGALDTTAVSPTHHNPKNRVVCFGGDEKTYLAVTGGTIYRTTDEFASWAAVQTLTGIASHGAVTGLHVVDLGGVPTVAIFYAASTNTARGFRSSDGVTWIDSGVSGTIASLGGAGGRAMSDEIVYHNVIYMYQANTGVSSQTTIWYYDPGANSFGGMASTVVNNSSGCFAIWKDMLVMTRHSSGTAQVLDDITTGVFSTLVTLAGAGTVVIAGQQNGAFVDPATGDLILFYYHTSPGGTLQCYRCDKTTHALTLITTTVLPVAVRALTSTFKARPYMDVEASLALDPNNPPIYVYFAANGTLGTAVSMYQWNGVASLMTLVDSGGNVAHALGTAPRPVGGQYSYTTGQHRLRVTGRNPVFGGVRYSFTCSSATGTDAVKVRGFYDDAVTETLSTPATLVNPSHGMINGVFNEGLTADRTTTYQVTWAAQTDGVSQGARMKFGLDVVAA